MRVATKWRVRQLATLAAVSLVLTGPSTLTAEPDTRADCPAADRLGVTIRAGRFTEWPRVRPTSIQMAGLLLEGLGRSPTLRALVDRLQTANVIVHVSMQPGPQEVAGSLTWRASAGGVRYLDASVTAAGTTATVIAALGHELEHALEVAEAAWVNDAAGFATLYSIIGERHHTGQPAWDTARAYDVGARILREFVSSPRDQGRHVRLKQPIEWFATYRCTVRP